MAKVMPLLSFMQCRRGVNRQLYMCMGENVVSYALGYMARDTVRY